MDKEITQKSAKLIYKTLKQSKLSPFITVLIIGSIIIASVLFLNNTPQPSISNDLYEVVHVADGDTITVKDINNKEFTVRYIGVDTPESVKPNSPIQCFAIEASNYNKELVLGKKVKMENDVEDKDKYDRLLRYVYLDQNNDGKYDEMVNETLVKDGFARILTIPPDVKYVDRFRQEETIARENDKGLWSKCNDNSIISNISSTPAVKGEGTSINSNEHPSGCDIKGNINTSGDKIYHTIGQKYYDKTNVDTSKGEKWFCTEADAQNAGFRKSGV